MRLPTALPHRARREPLRPRSAVGTASDGPTAYPMRQRALADGTSAIALTLSMALAWAVVQLAAGLSALTLGALAGSGGAAGVGLALALVAGAVSAALVEPLSRRIGRVPGISLGFALCAGASVLLFVAASIRSTTLYLAGLVLLGAGLGTVGLLRGSLPDLVPSARRGTAVARLLLGAAAGSIVAPFLFAPLLSRRAADPSTLAAPWLLAAALMAVGAGVVWAVRQEALDAQWPDPLEADTRLVRSPGATAADGALDGVVLAEPFRLTAVPGLFASSDARAALVALVAAQVALVGLLVSIGPWLRQAGHDLGSISLAVAVLFTGMFSLAPLVGRSVDRIGRRRGLLVGLAAMAAGALALAIGPTLGTVLPALFGLGLGWCLASVAGSTLLADASRAHERSRALAAAGITALVAAAGAALVGALLVTGAGMLPLAILMSAATLAPAGLMVRPPAARRDSARPA
ncbi:MAG TPA: MFS transporter [Candidatus Limnocylindrales bacterium]|nr:MFS transporter [Candidatus Limnocylindrales bacterium]